MVRKTFCDRCGRECDHTYLVTLRDFGWQEYDTTKVGIQFCSPEKLIDLCGGCFGDIKLYIEGGQVVE